MSAPNTVASSGPMGGPYGDDHRFRIILGWVQKLQEALQTRLGATGNSFGEQCRSVQHCLDEPLTRALDDVVRAHGKLAQEPGYAMPNLEAFDHRCAAAFARLLEVERRPAPASAPLPPPVQAQATLPPPPPTWAEPQTGSWVKPGPSRSQQPIHLGVIDDFAVSRGTRSGPEPVAYLDDDAVIQPGSWADQPAGPASRGTRAASRPAPWDRPSRASGSGATRRIVWIGLVLLVGALGVIVYRLSSSGDDTTQLASEESRRETTRKSVENAEEARRQALDRDTSDALGTSSDPGSENVELTGAEPDFDSGYDSGDSAAGSGDYDPPGDAAESESDSTLVEADSDPVQADVDEPASDVAASPIGRCDPLDARARASRQYAAGNACGALDILRECCLDSDAACRSLSELMTDRCRR